MAKKRYKIEDLYIKEIGNDMKIEIGHFAKLNTIDICKRLNGGSGFNGFTPSFFTTAYIKENNKI